MILEDNSTSISKTTKVFSINEDNPNLEDNLQNADDPKKEDGPKK